MKKYYALIVSAMIFTGCNLEEINENPNVPLEVPLSTLLPPTQKAICDVQGDDVFQYTNIFSQHMEGVDNQPLRIENYRPDELFVGNAWSDLYVDGMINLTIIIERADAEGAPHYAGVARILQVQALGLLTDIWGDVPFTEATLGSENQNPGYDGQEFLYGRIQAILNRAIADLQQPSSVFSPGSDDIIYGGNLQNWIATAHVLNSCYFMHAVKRDPAASALALEELTSGYTSSGQDWQYPYLGTGTDLNPLFSFFDLTPYAEVDPQFVELMEELDDPRIDYAFEIIPFTGGRRRPGDFYASPESPVKLASYLEQLFLEAEALARTGDTPGAQSALEEAVSLSMNEVSFGAITQEEADTYLAAHTVLSGNLETDLETVITQKYIAMFTTPEPWTDYRRTGYPDLEPNPDGITSSNPNGEIPRRLIYPQSERLRNTSFPSPAPNMQDRFWWDQ
jgi:hypothetical protein